MDTLGTPVTSGSPASRTTRRGGGEAVALFVTARRAEVTPDEVLAVFGQHLPKYYRAALGAHPGRIAPQREREDRQTAVA